jgi:hypothetical protein
MTQAINASGWPIIRGIQTVKEVSYLNMRTASAAAALNKLWSDTFLTNAGIYAAGSASYTYQGTPNFNVIKAAASALSAVPVMTSATAPSGNVYSSAPTGDGTHPAWQIFDALPEDNTQWITNAQTTGWIAYKFTSAKVITSYVLYGSNTDSRNAKTWKLQGSNDSTDGNNGTWTDLDTQTNITNLGTNPAVGHTYSFANSTAYQSYRINVSANNGGTELSIFHLKLIEAAAASASIVSVLALDLATDINQVMMFADVTLGTGTATYWASTDDGSTWTTVPALETLVSVPAGKKIRLKVVITGNASLDAWGVAV